MRCQLQVRIRELIQIPIKIGVKIGLGRLGKIGVRIGVQIGVQIGLDLFLTIKTYFNPILNILFKDIGIQRGQRPKAAGP